jgi:hypothetical protein
LIAKKLYTQVAAILPSVSVSISGINLISSKRKFHGKMLAEQVKFQQMGIVVNVLIECWRILDRGSFII